MPIFPLLIFFLLLLSAVLLKISSIVLYSLIWNHSMAHSCQIHLFLLVQSRLHVFHLLPCAKHCPKYFTYMISFNLPNIWWIRVLLATFKKNWLLEKSSNLPEVLELIDGRAGTGIQARNLNFCALATTWDSSINIK